MSAVINSKLQASRKELLDIGLRNNLINFKKNAKTLTLIKIQGCEIFDALYVNEEALGFGATEKLARKGTGDIVKTASVDYEKPDVKKLQLPKTAADMQNMVDAAMLFQQHKKSYDEHSTLGGTLFGGQLQATKSD